MDQRLVRVADLVVVDAPAAARPGSVAVASAAPTHALALASLGEVLTPITQDACAFYEDDGKVDLVPGVGLVAHGETVEAAAWWLVTAERSSQVQLAALSAGRPVPIRAEVAADTARATGGAATGRRQFGPLYDWITRLEPELLEG